ncbi:MAG: SDR family oxidoreductase [Actinobacteria bacterium]|nr:SDR family oxidoreductase [Actinomycetota bacterium]
MSTLQQSARDEHEPSPPIRRDGLLLSGATGFLGTELLARYLQQSDRMIFAIVRANDHAHAQRRLHETLESAFDSAAPFSSRVRALAGDMTLPGLGLDPEVAHGVAHAVDEIVHGAAAVSFDLDLEQARAINVQGTRAMLELAALCQRHGGLRRFTYISTAYVAGLHKGRFYEDDLDVGQRFRNPYEQSKFESEQLVRAHVEQLPITVVRPSIIVGDSRTGWTASFNVLYWPTRALARGAFAVLPARRRSPVDVVSVDYVADAVRALAAMPDAAGRTFHLTSGRDATSIGELLALACAELQVKAPPLIAPALYLRALGPLLGRLQPRRRAFLRAAATYVPYFAVRTQFDDARARAALGAQLRPKPLGEYYGRIIDYARHTRWGARPMSRAAAAREAAVDLAPESSLVAPASRAHEAAG